MLFVYLHIFDYREFALWIFAAVLLPYLSISGWYGGVARISMKLKVKVAGREFRSCAS